MKYRSRIAAVLAVILLLLPIGTARADGQNFGSAGFISGRTVIISILADDDNTAWNGYDDVEQLRLNLLSATQWLSECVRAYGGHAEFIFDWSTTDGLLYSAAFPGDYIVPDGSLYHVQRDWLETYFPIEETKEKFGADNVIYMFHFNTPYENPVHSFAMNWEASCPLDYEIINDFIRFEGYDMQPSSYAHEILHCFGAHDLYFANPYIPQEYVDFLTDTSSRDIMFATFIGERILNVFTPLCAYYVGLLNSCSEVARWELAPSVYF